VRAKRAAPQKVVSRRAVLWSTAAAFAAMVTGDWMSRLLVRSKRRPSAASFPIEIEGAADLAPGKAIGFELASGEGSGLLIHTDAGLRAFERACPHLGCPVLWSEEKRTIECPCHAAAFDADTGAVLAGPPQRGLIRLDVQVQAGRVLVSPGRSIG